MGDAPWREGSRPWPLPQFYRAYGRESRFVFAGEAGSPVRLRLTCRLPAPPGARMPLVVTLNGQPQAEIEAGGS